MNVYLFATVLGLLGLALMAVLGMAHAAGHAHGPAAHPAGHSGHAPALKAIGTAHGPSPTSLNHSNHAATPNQATSVSGALLSLASPRVLLSLALGFGLTGLLLRSLLPALVVLPLALLGAALFEGLLLRPYWNFLLRFESRPSSTLASAAGGPALAATDFGRSGAGLVTFELNGETRQLLARLEDPSQPVRRGDALVIQGVDESANACTVRRS